MPTQKPFQIGDTVYLKGSDDAPRPRSGPLTVTHVRYFAGEYLPHWRITATGSGFAQVEAASHQFNR